MSFKKRVPVILVPNHPPDPLPSLRTTALTNLCNLMCAPLQKSLSGAYPNEPEVLIIREYIKGLPRLLRNDLFNEADAFTRNYSCVDHDECEKKCTKLLNLAYFRTLFHPVNTTKLSLYNVVLSSPMDTLPICLWHMKALNNCSFSAIKLRYIEHIREAHERENGMAEGECKLGLKSLTLSPFPESYKYSSQRFPATKYNNAAAQDEFLRLLPHLSNLERLELIEFATDNILYELGQACKKLTFLRLQNMGKHKENDVKDYITDEGIVDLIEELSMDGAASALKVLDISHVAVNSAEVLDRVTGRSLCAIASMLPNLVEVRLRLEHFKYCKLSLEYWRSENSFSGSQSVRTVHIVGRKSDVENLQEVADHLLLFFPNVKSVSFDAFFFDEGTTKLEDVLSRLPRHLIKSVTVQEPSSDHMKLFPAAEQFFISDPRIDFGLEPDCFTHLKRVVMSKNPFSIPFATVSTVLANCPQLQEILVRSPKIPGATDDAFQVAFNSNPGLHRLRVFYLCAYEVDMELTDVSLSLLLTRCGETLRRVGYIQTWSLINPNCMEYDADDERTFVAKMAPQAQKRFGWRAEWRESSELSDMSRVFYNEKD